MPPTNNLNPNMSIASISDGVIYDDEAGMCYPAEPPICQAPPSESGVTSPPVSNRFVRLSPERIYYEGMVRPQNPSGSGSNWASYLLGPAALMGCSGPASGEPIIGDPIAAIESLTEETFLNSEPIKDLVRQPVLDFNSAGRWSAAWSVVAEFTPEINGTFVTTGTGASGSSTVLLEAGSTKQRGTSVVTLENGETVVSFFRLRGDDVPSEVVGQRLDSGGRPLGEEFTILPSAIRTQDPQVRLLAQSDGFLAVYLEDGELAVTQFDLLGNEVGRESLARDATSFSVHQGSSNEWGLAEVIGPNQVRVRTIEGTTPTGITRTLTTETLSANPKLSVALQDDGSMMVAWNAVLGGNDSIIEGAFLDSDGFQIGGNRILRNVSEGSGFDHEGEYNSHHLTTDHRGNFILVYEENREVLARVYQGDQEVMVMGDISSDQVPESGPYSGLVPPPGESRVRAENVDVQVGLDSSGRLSFLYLKIIKGLNPDTGLTVTFQAVTRRDFQIRYE